MKFLFCIIGFLGVSPLSGLAQLEQSKKHYKAIIGIEFQKIGELNSRVYLDVIAFNNELVRGIVYTDSTQYPINHFLTGNVDFQNLKLIEFETSKIDTSKSHFVWIKKLRVWSTEDESNVWHFGKRKVKIKLPAANSILVRIQDLNGKMIEKVNEDSVNHKTTIITLSRKRIGKGNVLVSYFESEDKVYLSFFRNQ
ncbi:MAG: hypothetical protein HYZ44_11560 [Bacteroidetes bacterium]|nr:hypothetical protein [Bacteroidota bacterium]